MCDRCDNGEHGNEVTVKVYDMAGEHVRTYVECECCRTTLRSTDNPQARFPWTGNVCEFCHYVQTFPEGDGYVCERTDSILVVQGDDLGDYWSMPVPSAVRSGWAPALMTLFRHDEARYCREFDKVRLGNRF
jgi:hypothetical protein